MGLTNAMTAMATLLISLIMTGVSTSYARRRGLIDLPVPRSSHQQATPRGGGAGIVIAILAGSLLLDLDETVFQYWCSAFIPPLLAIALVGGWDDHKPVSAWLRILVHCAAACYLLINVSSGHMLPETAWFAVWFVLALIFVVWMINLYNFMDGSNGMAGAQGVFSGLALCGLMWHAGDVQAAMIPLLIAVACAGFLPWNLGNARVFMGDVGSTSLGFAFAAVIVYAVSRSQIELPVALLVIVVFGVDSGCTLAARVFRGERWYNAHKQHVYQRLIMHRWPHGRVLLLYQLINLLIVAPGLVLAVNFPELGWLISLTTTLILAVAWYLTIRRIGAFA